VLSWAGRVATNVGEYAYIALGSLVLLVGTVVLPTMSVTTGSCGCSKQALFVLAPLIVVGASLALRPICPQDNDITLCALVGLLFVSLDRLYRNYRVMCPSSTSTTPA